MKQNTIRVWDLPTRLFHWLLVIAITAAWVSGDFLDNEMNIHQWVGIGIVGLITFRIVWGFIGGTYARFWQFIGSPKQCLLYVQGKWQGMGHNPLGGRSAVAMMLLVAAMVITGLFANNDADYTAPLTFLVSNDVSSQMTSLHKLFFNALWILIALHIVAIFFYKWVLKKDLLTPMVTGDAVLPDACQDVDSKGGGWLALVVALAIAIAAMWAASAAWYTPPPKVAAPQGLDF